MSQNNTVAERRGVQIVEITVGDIGGLIACAVGLASFFGLGSVAHNTFDLWAQQADTLIDTMEASMETQLLPVVSQSEWIAQ